MAEVKIEIFDPIEFTKTIVTYPSIEVVHKQHYLTFLMGAKLYNENAVYGYRPKKTFLKVKVDNFNSPKDLIKNLNNAEFNKFGGNNGLANRARRYKIVA